MVVYEKSIIFPTNILNHSSQSSEDFMEIYILKILIKYGHPNYVHTFMYCIRMTQILEICSSGLADFTQIFFIDDVNMFYY